MRADRLVATLLLLQARGTVTAREVADELEVSERTARRDLDALSVAGIPVYSTRGRGGGWRLVGGASTDLTGLRSTEARALLTMAAAAGQTTPEFRAAIAKLTQALPEPMREEATAWVAAIVTDDRPWGNVDSIPRAPRRDHWIEPLQGAVVAHRQVDLGYEHPVRGTSQRVIEPLGLVTKRGLWYVVAGTAAGRRTFRIDRITSVAVLDEAFEPPAAFDLEATWEEITSGYVERSQRVSVRATVDEWALGPLRSLGVEVKVGASVTDGAVRRKEAELSAWNVEVLTSQIAGLIHSIELHDPPGEVVERLASIGDELRDRYSTRSVASDGSQPSQAEMSVN